MRCFTLEAPGRIALRDQPVPEPGPGEVVVRVRAALTCGTDVKAFRRGHPKWPMPTPFGHEFSGTIAAIGAGVQGWREGDAVMAAPTAPCGHCFFCQRQDFPLCETLMETMVLGAFGEYLRLPERIVRHNLYAKHAHLSFAEAALLEPLACVFHGLAELPLRDDDVAVLLGAGAISLLFLRTLQSLGVRRVIVIGRSPGRARAAVELGASEVWLDGMESAVERIREQTAGRGADLVIECTGQPEVWSVAPRFARRGGRVILFGGCPPGSTFAVDTQRFHYEQVRLTSPFHYDPEAVRRAWRLLGDPEFGAASFVTATLPLGDLAEALERHSRGEGVKFALNMDT